MNSEQSNLRAKIARAVQQYPQDKPLADLAPLVHTVEEAAKRIAIGRTTFYSLMAEGKIRTIQIGARRLVPESSLVEFVEHALTDAKVAS